MRTLPEFRFLLVVVLLFAFLAQASVAQAVDEFDRSRYERAAFYNYAEAADVTIYVSAWGAVRNPGLYEVPRDMRLSRFFSITGGPNIGEQRRGQEQTLTVRLSRANAEGEDRSVVFETRMQDAVLTFDEDPILQEGDVLTVERYTRPRFTWRDTLPIVGTAASVASTVILLLQALTN